MVFLDRKILQTNFQLHNKP